MRTNYKIGPCKNWKSNCEDLSFRYFFSQGFRDFSKMHLERMNKRINSQQV